MSSKKRIQNIISSKYFVILTLTAIALAFVIFHLDGQIVPKGSLQLSSEATPTSPQIPLMAASAQEEYYDLQIRLQNPLPINTSFGVTATLEAGSLVSIPVPSSMIGDTTDLSQSHLAQIINNVNQQSGNFLPNEFDILEAQNPKLIQTSGTAYLSTLLNNENINPAVVAGFRKHTLRIESIEKDEDDDDADAPEGQVACLTCNNHFNPLAKATGTIRDIISGNYNKPIHTIVENYENSQLVRNLMTAAKKGYWARNSRGRTTFVRAPPKVSGHSIRACYNGVKRLLEVGGVIKNVHQLPDGSAKNAGRDLQALGFINLMNPKYQYANNIKSPEDAPIGSILVYEGYGRRLARDKGYPNGHAEVRVEKGFMSDYYSETPRTGSGLTGNSRRLIGVYIKPSSTVHSVAVLEDGRG
jgi:hypothetical protein